MKNIGIPIIPQGHILNTSNQMEKKQEVKVNLIRKKKRKEKKEKEDSKGKCFELKDDLSIYFK